MRKCCFLSLEADFGVSAVLKKALLDKTEHLGSPYAVSLLGLHKHQPFAFIQSELHFLLLSISHRLALPISHPHLEPPLSVLVCVFLFKSLPSSFFPPHSFYFFLLELSGPITSSFCAVPKLPNLAIIIRRILLWHLSGPVTNLCPGLGSHCKDEKQPSCSAKNPDQISSRHI